MTLHAVTTKQYVTNDVIGCDNKAVYNKWYSNDLTAVTTKQIATNDVVGCDNKTVCKKWCNQWKYMLWQQSSM